MAKRTYIKELTPGQMIEGVFAIQNCQLGQTRGGKPFIKCLLGDKTGQAPGRMWNATEELFQKLPTDGFVWIEGQTQPYQGEMQIIIQQIGGVEPSPEDLAELLPCTQYDVEEMYAEVRMILGTLEHPAIRKLADAYLADGNLMAKFKQAPAAMTLHHAFLGGLLEHTLSLLRVAQALLPLYPQVNRDIVLMGVFLHDMGKCEELKWTEGFGYTDDGQLLGHIARGAIWLNEKAAGQVPTPILQALQHIILSHHGVPEFGALKIPSTREAIFVSHIDNLDAKMQMAISATAAPAAGQQLGGNFTEKVWALDTRLYRPDPTTVTE